LYFRTPKLKKMFAIVEVAGQQFKVKQDDKLFVHRLEGNTGDSVTTKVLMVDNNGAITMNSGSVTAEIITHLQGDKVITFHKNRRKGFAKKIGHRQQLTQIKINSIA
jgi:large subunit ribosomal protein L21